MAIHTELSPAQAADRLAIRELFDAYAHCADTRDAEGQQALFTADTRFAVYLGGEGTEAELRHRGARGPDAGLRRPQAVPGDHALQRPEHGRPRR